MEGRIVWPFLFAAAVVGGWSSPKCLAQVTLADDIILAAEGKEAAERNRKTKPIATPGARALPYRRSPGSNDVLLGVDPNRRFSPLPRLARRPANPDEIAIPRPTREEFGHGLAPSIEVLRQTDGSLPATKPTRPGARSRSEPIRSRPSTPNPASPSDLNDFSDPSLGDDDDPGPPNGLTLDAAIDRVVRGNPELRGKFLEIPQAQADIVTAGLRENPLLFYSSDGVPYGDYSKQRPGEINHGISLVVPVDYTGKREARIHLAERERSVLEAQYRDAVRLTIDDLHTVYVDALAQRQAVRSAARGLELLERLLAQAQAKPDRREADEITIDDLTIERELAEMSLGDERDRYGKAVQRLAALLGYSPREADALSLHGSLREIGPPAPPFETLIAIALQTRPDLIAQRLGVERALAEAKLERAERFADAYLLYTPFQYRDNSKVGLASSAAWGAGLFVSVPLFNRNQGNLRRASLNVAQTQGEVAALRNQVIEEVRQALRDFENTYHDAHRLETVVIPAVRRKRDRAWRALNAGRIDVDSFLSLQRDSSTIVRYRRDTLARHRRNALRINTVVGRRVLP